MTGTVPHPRTAVLRRLVDPISGEPVDRGLVLWFPAPQTFTGEDIAEFQVHGGRAVIAAMLSSLARLPDCRMAEPGEFALRAFENGKLDLTQAEGLADLIDAETDAQRRQALRQADGALSRLSESWRSQLLAAMGLVEAAIDFSDEGDVARDAVEAAEARVIALLSEISNHLEDGHRGEILRDGYQVVLAGAPNVGKSSLLNALARRDVAIVSTEAGTTRDVIEVRLDLGGLPVIVSDTAGLREAAGAVEEEGIRRSLARTREANLILWVIDASARHQPERPPGLTGSIEAKILIVANKADLAAASTQTGHAPDLLVSAATGAGLETLTRRIAQEAARVAETVASCAVITQGRHRQHIAGCRTHLTHFMAGRDVELRAEELRLAADALGRITGRIGPEDILDQVFGRFCIGK